MTLYTVVKQTNGTLVVCEFEPGVNVFVPDTTTPELDIVKKWSVSGRTHFPDGTHSDPYNSTGLALFLSHAEAKLSAITSRHVVYPKS